MSANILEVFGNNSSKLPRIFYDCEALLPDKSIIKINKLFLFINSYFHSVYIIANTFPVDHRRGNQNITGYFYASMFSNIDSFSRFDIICKDKNTKLLIKGAAIKRNSGGSVFNYHSFYALNYEYIK